MRLVGINTPEMGQKGKPSQAFAKKAKNKLKKLLVNSSLIYLSYDKVKKDKYQRTLAYVSLPDGTDIQARLLSLGLAISIVIPPNDKRLNCYRKLEKQAQNSNLGIWQQKKYQPVRAKDLKMTYSDYRFVKGIVTSIKRKADYLIISLDKSISLKLSKKAFTSYYQSMLLGQQLLVRGWVYPYKKKFGMRINHPENIKFLE
ncbi:MAG: thermonuclease family protein [Pseudomonadota bacterium]